MAVVRRRGVAQFSPRVKRGVAGAGVVGAVLDLYLGVCNAGIAVTRPGGEAEVFDAGLAQVETFGNQSLAAAVSPKPFTSAVLVLEERYQVLEESVSLL